jgi:ABC-type nickel/cobalt efflux system permease component RcnA
MRRLIAATSSTLVGLLVLAPAALANIDGQGWYGESTDKAVTMAGFILIIFFPTFALVASLALWQLDKRKYARKAAHSHREHSEQWRGGW